MVLNRAPMMPRGIAVAYPVGIYSTHWEVFAQSCQSKHNLNCNYHFPVDLAPIGILSENGNYNPNCVWIDKIEQRLLCVMHPAPK